MSASPGVQTVPVVQEADRGARGQSAAAPDAAGMMHAVTLVISAELEAADPALRFLGPTLRGAFGHALKDVTCVNGSKRCDACAARPSCPYARVFDGAPSPDRPIMRRYPTVPQPFVLLVPGPGESRPSDRSLTWGIRLFGPAMELASSVIDAFLRVGQLGLGPNRTRFELTRVIDGEGRVVYRSGQTHALIPRPIPLPARALPDSPCSLRWRFHCPVHIRSGGSLFATPSGLDLVLSGRRRWSILRGLYGGPCVGLPEPRLLAEQFRVERVGLRPWSIQRFSGRQRRKVPLCGVLGDYVVSGPWHLAGQWLSTVESTHLGKHASFGFGRVSWEIV